MKPKLDEPIHGLLSRGRALLDLGRPSEAVVFFQRALSLEPNNADALGHLSNSYLKLGIPARALEFADRAVASRPDCEWGHRLRAHALLKLCKPKRALEPAAIAVRLAPTEPMALYTLGFTQLACRKHMGARETAERLRNLHPDSLLGHQLLSDTAIATERWAEAEAFAREALRLDPQSEDALNSLGIALLHQGDKREAIDVLHRAAKIDPQQLHLRSNLHQAIRQHTSIGASILFGYFGLRLLMMGAGALRRFESSTIVASSLIILGLMAGVAIWQRLRLRQLGPELRQFSRHEEQQSTRRTLRISMPVAGVVGALLGLRLMFGPPWNFSGPMWIVTGLLASYAVGGWMVLRRSR